MPSPTFDLRSLRYYVTAVEAKSISGAAKLCHVAQPSITLAISKLEDELNCTLLHRHRKGVEPTTKGSEFYHMAVELLSHAQGISNHFKDEDQTLHLSLSINDSIRVDYVGELLNHLNQKGHQPNLEIWSSDNADIRLTVKSQTRQNDVFLPLASEAYALLIPKEHILAHRSSLSINDLNGIAMIERLRCENQALLEKLMDHFDITFNSVAKVDTEEWALSLVRSGLGCTIAPINQGFHDDNMRKVELSTLLSLEIPQRQIGIAYGPELSPEKQSMIESVFDHT